ncbi:MAG: thiopurine S-methyltransferase [Gammaproteobacteria bacterium]|nr:thiopurine S-methyltransferase [Gammaproteobacteria bacterium]
MKADFWHHRWQDNLIGFHLDEINPYLKQFYSQLGLEKGQRIFVPLCGKTLDLVWLVEQGQEVTGVEISPLAVEQFFAEQDWEVQVEQISSFSIYRAAGITLYCGDFFELTPDRLGKVDAVYDRASLVALPPEMRTNYAAHLGQLCPAAIPRLLVSLDYDQTKMGGPPFAVSELEIAKLYAGEFNIEKLLALDILDERFRQKGLDHLEEAVYLLK